ncbi:MAG: amino acid adenylation domain-containing protein [Candidatus Wallbacteria bacterium]
MIEKNLNAINNKPSFELDSKFYTDEFLFEIFEKSADSYPDKTALIYGDHSLTYSMADEQSNKVASYLRKNGIRPSDRVMLMLEKSEFLYIAMLGIIKAGGAYVPLDPATPCERVEYIMKDSGAKMCITQKNLWNMLAGKIEKSDIKFLYAEDSDKILSGESGKRISAEETGLDRNALFNMCYIIYTSGTTGKPKGCILDHKNICNFVRGATYAYGIKPEDRVLQCASISFDASLEEIWMAFANGGTLISATKEIMRSGPKFSEIVSNLKISVISCTPTFISMAEGDISTLRILILGGEACPKDVVKRWYSPNRVIFNSYGPTEATVAATIGELRPDKIITIGKPLPNYQIYILDEMLNMVTPGTEGEIFIAGPGVARGYLNMDEADSLRFIFLDKLTGTPICLYKTGDIGRLTDDGEIEYLGRSDTQIKLRGFRIELSEIESVLMQDPGILMAAVTLHNNAKQLAAFVVKREGKEIDYKMLRERLKKNLPPYMIPAFLDEVESLPVSISGKINRKLLPAAVKPFVDSSREIITPRNSAEEKVYAIWKKALDIDMISVTDDFFLDLGGHSLLAATAASALRKIPEFSGISVGDIYKYPTIEKLAGTVSQNKETADAIRDNKQQYNKTGSLTYIICALGQFLAFFPLALIGFWEWLFPFFLYGRFSAANYSPMHAALLSLTLYLISFPLVLGVIIICKWLIIGKIKPGQYPLWGFYYFRYWLSEKIIKAYPLWILDSTPLVNVFYRLMGAKIGNNVYISKAETLPYDLITIKDGSSVGAKSSLNSAYVENGFFVVKGIEIGKNCVIGNRCILGGNNILHDNSGLDCLSMLPADLKISSGEFWGGSPAVLLRSYTPPEPSNNGFGTLNIILLSFLVFLFPAAMEALFFPGLIIFEEYSSYSESLYAWFLISPFLALAFILLLLTVTAVSNRLLLFGIKEGKYELNSFFYIRYWLFSQISKYSINVCSTIFATIYSRLWFKAAGVSVGKNAEISYVSGLIPGLTDIGEGCFLADDAMIGMPVVNGGSFLLSKTSIGDKTFIGNSALVPIGSTIPGGCLIGVQSRPPENKNIEAGSSWLGSPAIFLPVRQKSDNFSEELIFRPPAKMVMLRYFIEFFKAVTPLSVFIMLACIILNKTESLFEAGWSFMEVLALCPIMYIFSGFFCMTLIVILKWILIGRFHEEKNPLWSVKVWISEFIVGIYENLAVLLFIEPLCGTPFIGSCLRILGSKIGWRCYINTPYLTEFDLISIGDESEINDSAILQTHLFEDRVMKCGRIEIGKRATIGAETIILYDVKIDDDTQVGDNSLIMKGETLPAGTKWHGIPGKNC